MGFLIACFVVGLIFFMLISDEGRGCRKHLLAFESFGPFDPEPLIACLQANF